VHLHRVGLGIPLVHSGWCIPFVGAFSGLRDCLASTSCANHAVAFARISCRDRACAAGHGYNSGGQGTWVFDIANTAVTSVEVSTKPVLFRERDMHKASLATLTSALLFAASTALAQAPTPEAGAGGGIADWLANWWWIILLVVLIAAALWYFMGRRTRV
jgi:hypothetical protein